VKKSPASFLISTISWYPSASATNPAGNRAFARDAVKVELNDPGYRSIANVAKLTQDECDNL